MLSFLKAIAVAVTLILLCIALPGCYPMPQDGVYSTIPTTNNPDVVGSHGGNELMPGGGF